ncbi:MAG: hypothetical protein HY901_31685 [Deltaproteobacteria bacterium]|nr:hypothetical protein [Deltaproteobacteria bacterium]
MPLFHKVRNGLIFGTGSLFKWVDLSPANPVPLEDGDHGLALRQAASLGFNPREFMQAQLPLDKPLDRLDKALLEVFAGRRLTVEQVFAEHNVGTNYLLTHYKEVLRRLEEKDVVEASPTAEARPKLAGDKVSMAGDVIISFPKA